MENHQMMLILLKELEFLCIKYLLIDITLQITEMSQKPSTFSIKVDERMKGDVDDVSLSDA